MLGTVSTGSTLTLHPRSNPGHRGKPARKVTFRSSETRPASTTTTEPPGTVTVTSFFSHQVGGSRRGPPSPVGPIYRPLPSATLRAGGASSPESPRAGGASSPAALRSRGSSPTAERVSVRSRSAGSGTGGTRAPTGIQRSQGTPPALAVGAVGSLRPQTQGAQRPPSSASPHRVPSRHRQRPKTTTSLPQHRSRPLGAELYPTLQRADEEREKALFRSTVTFLCQALGGNVSPLRSPSARWLEATSRSSSSPGPGGQGSADSFCRASRAESHMNNADVAKVFHVIPQRVVSARGSGRQGLNVSLQQLNQTLCLRRHSLHKNLTAPTTTTTTTNGDVNRPNSNSATRTSGKHVQSSAGTHRSLRSSGGHVSSSPRVSAQSRNFISPDGAERDLITPYSVDEGPGDGGGRWFGSQGFPLSPRALSQQSVRGVECQQHSAEWAEESRMKAEESMVILSQQLSTMMPTEQQAEVLKIPSQGEEEAGAEVSPSARFLHSPSLTNMPSYEFTASEEEPQVETNPERVACMKTMQCEVLGPYSCADCTKIRLHERQQMEQTSLYPGLAVDPRVLVAPATLRKLTASLPSNLTSQRHRLDCGCAIRMHQDFLFPVLVTNHEVHSRLRAARAASSVEGRLVTSPTESEHAVLLTRREPASARGSSERAEERKGVNGENEEHDREDVKEKEAEDEDMIPMSPRDMKVTVRYNSPSSEEKSVFIT